MRETRGTVERYRITANGVEPISAWRAYLVPVMLASTGVAVAVAVLVFHVPIDLVYLGSVPGR